MCFAHAIVTAPRDSYRLGRQLPHRARVTAPRESYRPARELPATVSGARGGLKRATARFVMLDRAWTPNKWDSKNPALRVKNIGLTRTKATEPDRAAEPDRACFQRSVFYHDKVIIFLTKRIEKKTSCLCSHGRVFRTTMLFFYFNYIESSINFRVEHRCLKLLGYFNL